MNDLAKAMRRWTEKNLEPMRYADALYYLRMVIPTPGNRTHLPLKCKITPSTA